LSIGAVLGMLFVGLLLTTHITQTFASNDIFCVNKTVCTFIQGHSTGTRTTLPVAITLHVAVIKPRVKPAQPGGTPITSPSVTAPAPQPTAPPVTSPAPVAGGISGMINEIFGAYGSGAINVARCESGLNPSAYNPSGASGLFQIMPSTWARTSQAGSSPYNAQANAIAAHEIFVRDGYSWREWTCQP